MNKSYRFDEKIIKPKRISDLFSKRTLGNIYLSSTLEFLHLLLKLGAKPGKDGWRKYATAFLRTEDSRFLLTAFKLKTELEILDDDIHIKTKQWIIEQLARFFTTYPQLWNTRLVWNRHGASIQPNKHLDIVWAEFDNDRNLSLIRTFFDVDEEFSSEYSQHPYADLFIQAYNKTLFTGRQRPYHLLLAFRELLKNTLDEKAGIEFAQRVLDSVFVHFESIQADKKLDFPDFSVSPHPGGGAFNILCRLQSPDYRESDLWFHINHALHDGNPVLEAINNLKKIWGTSGAMVFPKPPQDRKTFSLVQPAHNDSGRDLVYAHQYLSFEHLLKERERLNQKYSHLLNAKITVPGMIVWGLSNQSFLKDIKFTIIVDVPANSNIENSRTLGFITNKPNEFLDESDRELSFVHYQKYINDAIESVRKREDLTYVVLKSQALMPITSYEMTLSLVPQAVYDIGGNVSLTIMPLADYCAPPADDTRAAVIAIGNFMMPTEDGKFAGAICIKSVKDDMHNYWKSVYNTITHWQI